MFPRSLAKAFSLCALLLFVLLVVGGCKRPYRVGDHILVDWRGGFYPAVIVGIEGASRYRVHYDGYGDDWEEWISPVRIQQRLSTSASAGPVIGAPKPAPRTNASTTAATQPAGVYRVGDRVRVEWRGTMYMATVVAVLEGDRYRVHYDTYGQEWDENVGLNRIQRK